MTVRVEDRKPRTIGFGGTVSTIDGVGIAAYWAHRNLFGRAERLRFDAGVDGLGGSLNPDDYDYNLGVTFTKPGVWTPDTDFITSLIGQRVNFDTYQERSVTASAGISQLFGDHLTGEILANASRSRYVDGFGVRHFTIFGVVGRGAYDRRDVPLDATRGYYLAAEVNPFYEAEFGNVAVRGTLEGRTYHGFGQQDKVVLAGRAKVGSYVGTDIERKPAGSAVLRRRRRLDPRLRLPLDRRRDHRRRRRGPVRGRRQGAGRGLGRAALPDQPELGRRRLRRQRPRHRRTPTSRGDNDFRTGVGLGVRYFTSIGILRADLATPVNPRPEDSPVALYIGIGQAF